MHKLLIAAAALAALTLAGQASAREAGTPATTVSAHDIDFSDRASVKALYTRLNRAAAKVCDRGAAANLLTQGDRLCIQAALADAVQKVNRPLLTAMYEQSSQTSPASRRG